MQNSEDLVKRFEKEIKEDPNNVVAHYNLGDALQGLGRVDEALAQYKKALELDPNNFYSALSHYNTGLIYYHGKNLEEAIKEFQKTIEDLPKLEADGNIKSNIGAKAYYNMGCAFFDRIQLKEVYGSEKQDMANAQENFRKALEFNPDFSKARNNLTSVSRLIKYGWSVTGEKGRILKLIAGSDD